MAVEFFSAPPCIVLEENILTYTETMKRRWTCTLQTQRLQLLYHRLTETTSANAFKLRVAIKQSARCHLCSTINHGGAIGGGASTQ